MKRFDVALSTGQLKEEIIKTADKRFRAFGFKKTAMAEIADDLGMSAANLYRYFPSKLDIAEAFALCCFEEKEADLLTAVQVSMTPSNCLTSYALALLHYNFEQLHDFPKINEIIMTLCDEKPELVDRKIQGELVVIDDIIRRGCIEEEWQVVNVESTSKAILSSWVMFTTPMFMKHKTIEELEERLRCILQLLLTGLEKRI